MTTAQTSRSVHVGPAEYEIGATVDCHAPGASLVVHERLPLGEVEIRRGEHVHAVNGTISRVHGLVVDPAEQHLTHVLASRTPGVTRAARVAWPPRRRRHGR